MLQRGHLSSLWAALPAAALVLTFAFSDRFSRDALHTGWIDAASVLVIFLLAHKASVLTRFLSRPVIVLLGEASYALYVLHVPLRDSLRGLVNRVPAMQQIPQEGLFIIYLVSSLWLAVMTFKYIERPARQRIDAWAWRTPTGDTS